MNTKHQSGFTAVELIITITVAGIFVIALYQLFGTINASMSLARQKAVASEIAYSYLRRYTGANVQPATWFTCSTAAGSSNTNDYTVNTNAAGQTIASGSVTGVTTLPGPVTYSVKALAVYGCSGANAGTPLRIESTVTYGPANRTVRHATLVRY